MWLAEESGFYFHTGATKEVVRQLKANPKLEVCVRTPNLGRMMRVAGETGYGTKPLNFRRREFIV